MNFPCDTHVNCPGFDGSPVINNSSESPDQLTFLGVAYGPNYNPPLGWQWGTLTNFATCESTVSQADADACAQGISVANTTATWVPPSGQSNPIRVTFGNDALSGSADCPDGLQFFYDVPAGRFRAGSKAAANQAAQNYANEQAIIHQLCFSDLPSTICQGAEVNLEITATSSFVAPPGVNTWTVTSGNDTLPPGLTFNSADTGPATLTGTPTTPGDYDFVIGVTLPNGDFSQKEFFMTVAGITNGTALPQAMVGTPYNATLETLGFSNPDFSVTDEPLPDGLALDSFGNITGTPAADAVTGTFTVNVRDSLTDLTCVQQVTINVAAGFNFNQTTWTTPDFGPQINPNPPVGAEIVVAYDGGGSDSSTAQGQIPNLPGTVCNLKITITNFDDPDSGWVGPNFNLQINSGDLSGTNPVISVSCNPDLSAGNGVYEFPFVLPNNGDPNIFITVFCNAFTALVLNMTCELTPAS